MFKGKILVLQQTFDNLKQLNKKQYIKSNNSLESLGFKLTYSDPSIFINENKSIIISLYIDDILMLNKNLKVVKAIIEGIIKRQEIKELGFVN